jgi:hypothetical protein
MNNKLEGSGCRLIKVIPKDLTGASKEFDEIFFLGVCILLRA